MTDAAATLDSTPGASAGMRSERVDGILTVARLHDPIVERIGVSASAAYTEKFWLPVIGPTALLALRRFEQLLRGGRDQLDIDSDELAGSLGVNAQQLHRTLSRLERFGLLRRISGRYLEVRCTVPPLPARHLEHLPASLRAAHDQLTGGDVTPAT